jgi:hypothetical protein
MDHYAHGVVQLIAMLLRPENTVSDWLSPQMVEPLKNLRDSLEVEDIESSSNFIYEILISVWTSRWIPSVEHPLVDPTICYLAYSTICKDGSFQEPKLITSPIAQLQFCMRLIFLRAIHGFDDHEEGIRQFQAYFVEKSESTFNSLRTLQHLASSLAYSTLSLPKVWWKDRKSYNSLLYRGDVVDFSNFPSMFENLDKEMMEVWEKKVLLGQPLHVSYDRLCDDLSNNTPGYSFMSDPRNPFHSKYNPNQLMMSVLGNEELRRRFVLFSSPDVMVWNVPEFKSWLSDYASLQLMLAARFNMTSGSPSRATEMTAMLRINTGFYPMRNLVMFGKHLTLLCTYLKTSAVVRYDKCIPHALDSFSSDLMIQDLAIARPFAELASLISYRDQPSITHLYRKHVFVNHNRLFETPDITDELNRITLKSLGVKLGVNSWRHVSTAFRRKHCSAMEELHEADGQDSIQALQSGHNRHTENRVYGLSADALSGVSEDFLPLFLEASTEWQVVCGVVPGGLGLPYENSTGSSFSSLVKSGRIRVMNPEGVRLSLADEIKAHIDLRFQLLVEMLESELIEGVDATHGF